MKFLIKILALILLVASGAWFWLKPGFDSGIAAITALIMLLGLFSSDKLNVNSLRQKVSRNSCGIQAGGNVTISTGKEKE
ncbi:hypothetical protein ACM918_001444 [Cronobacter malonaticus]|uniref:hypothetical protein n=1 Tax=Cronobacter malonaticus TaxID=413503 RepID=UPI000CFCE283|nr:hypothetical protein [Cronobacter malonaticus]MDT3580525.1 hypothetical protein [Cronobacter malonaticus]